jgi:hypothetical protein
MIRAFERQDAPAVAQLYELVMRSGRPSAPPGLAGYFVETMLEHPWSDPQIPPLVLVDAEGQIVAFQGSHVRRARLDGRSIRIACAGQLVAHPRARAGGPGALLVRAYLEGPQELTITDGATRRMREIWTLLGGGLAHLPCVTWTRVFAPGQLAAELLGGARRRPRRAAARTLATVDRAAARAVRPLAPAPAPSVLAESLGPGSMLEHATEFTRDLRLHLDYDRAYLDWLFSHASAVTSRGKLVAQLVREPRRHRVLGWYVYYLKPGASAQVLQVAAAERDAGPVIDHLLAHAWSGGATAVRGRVEPRLLAALGQRGCLLRFTGEALVHSDDAAVLDAIASGDSLLTRLDGEWWMGHHVLDFGAS